MHSPLYKKDNLNGNCIYVTRNQTKLKYNPATKRFYMYDEPHNNCDSASEWSAHLLHTNPDFDIMTVYADIQTNDDFDKRSPLAFRDCPDMNERKESCVLYAYSTQFYKMELIFKLSVSDIELNSVTSIVSKEHIIIEDAFDLKVEMTLPFIPSTEQINGYADAIKQQKEFSGKLIEKVHFAGYSYVMPITEPDKGADEKCPKN